MDIKPKVIKNKKDYHVFLKKFAELMEKEPKPGSEEFDLLEVLGVLIENYEREHYDLGTPDPIEAIKTRMKDKGWKQRDLIPLLGSPVVVSEVLNRKRNLTFEMMKTLSKHLNIPEKIFFLYEPRQIDSTRAPLTRALINELRKRNWISDSVSHVKEFTGDKLKSLFSNELIYDYVFSGTQSSRFRQQVRKGSAVNPLALKIWQYKALEIAAGREKRRFEKSKVTDRKLQELVRLSSRPDGIRSTGDFLAGLGIILVILPHLRKTHIDGAAMLMPESNTPVIALTLRHDRIDHFWFTLLHEIAHVCKHLGEEYRAIIEDLDQSEPHDQLEREANEFAEDHLIPPQEWKKFYQNGQGDFSPESVRNFAAILGIDPAIVAGRVRYETDDFRILSSLVGHKQVRERLLADYINH